MPYIARLLHDEKVRATLAAVTYRGSRRYQRKIFGKGDSDDITVGRQTRLYMKKQHVVLYVTEHADREVAVLDRKTGSVIPAHRPL